MHAKQLFLPLIPSKSEVFWQMIALFFATPLPEAPPGGVEVDVHAGAAIYPGSNHLVPFAAVVVAGQGDFPELAAAVVQPMGAGFLLADPPAVLLAPGLGPPLARAAIIAAMWFHHISLSPLLP
jgi:hypothetical protein